MVDCRGSSVATRHQHPKLKDLGMLMCFTRTPEADMGNQCSAEKWISSAIFCWLALTQEIDFSPFVLSSFFNSTFRFQILEALNVQASVSGWWDISVGSVWDWDPWELQAHLLEASEQMTGRKLLQSPAQYPWSLCKFDCLSASVHYMW